MKDRLTAVQRFFLLLKPYTKQVSQIYIYAILSGIVNLSLPLGIQTIILFIQTGEVSSSWIILIIFVLLGIVAASLFQYYQIQNVEYIQQDIFINSALEFAFRIPRFSKVELNSKYPPELVNRFFDTLTIQKGIPKILIDFSLATFQVIFGILLLSFYSSYFIALGIIIVFLIYLVYFFTGKKGLKTSINESKSKYNVAYWLEEVARMQNTFKMNENEGFHLKKTDNLVADYLKNRNRHFSVLLNQFKLLIVLKVVIAAILLILGGILVLNSQLNIGQFVAAEIIIILILNSLDKIIRIVETIYDVFTSVEKIGEVTDIPLQKVRNKSIFLNKGVTIKAKDLGFSFPQDVTPVFQGVSFQIDESDKVLIKSKSGKGKSTLLEILMGFYNSYKGEIYINDVPVNNFSWNNTNINLGVFFNNNEIFAGSILDNILIGREINSKKIYEIIEFLELNKFVALQENKLDTILMPGGTHISNQIRTKILLARAIIDSPELILLDNPVLDFDPGFNKKIIDYFFSKNQTSTVIVVSNDPLWEEDMTFKLINL